MAVDSSGTRVRHCRGHERELRVLDVRDWSSCRRYRGSVWRESDGPGDRLHRRIHRSLLVLLRPFLKGRIERSSNYVPSNTDRLIGKSGYVTEAVGERHGRIQFSGGEWSARTEGPELPVGAEVRVDRIDGATAIVSALNLAQPPASQPSAGSAS